MFLVFAQLRASFKVSGSCKNGVVLCFILQKYVLLAAAALSLAEICVIGFYSSSEKADEWRGLFFLFEPL